MLKSTLFPSVGPAVIGTGTNFMPRVFTKGLSFVVVIAGAGGVGTMAFIATFTVGWCASYIDRISSADIARL